MRIDQHLPVRQPPASGQQSEDDCLPSRLPLCLANAVSCPIRRKSKEDRDESGMQVVRQPMASLTVPRPARAQLLAPRRHGQPSASATAIMIPKKIGSAMSYSSG